MAQPVEQIFNQGVAHSYSENIKHSRTNFFVLLIAQLYCLLTIEATQDAALLSNATTQKLPILETTIGIETFYIIAPLVLLIIFIHFQIHLKSFFSSMGAGRPRRRARPGRAGGQLPVVHHLLDDPPLRRRR